MKRLTLAFLTALALTSCSTTRALRDDQYLLVENKVKFDTKVDVEAASLGSYVKQQAGKWSPGLSIYNWARPGSDLPIDNFWRKVGTAPVIFDESLVDDSVENIKSHLKHLGYYDSGITVQLDTARRKARVRYIVTPGRRYVIDSIAYHIPEGEFSDEFFADSGNVTVRTGDYLSEAALEDESVRSAAYFRNLGYYDFGKGNYFFEADTLGSRNILHYSIKGHTRNEPEENDLPIEKYTLGSVSITHSKDVPFNEKILRKVNLLKPGQTYNEKLVNVNYQRFSTLRVFNSVGIELEPLPDHTLDCTVNLRESKMQGVRFNLEASVSSSSFVGFSPRISYYHKNIFHGAERLNIDLSGNFRFKPGTKESAAAHSTELTGSVGLTLPRFVGLPYSIFKGPNIPRTEITATYGYQDRPEFDRNTAGFSFGYTGQVFNNFYFQFYPLQVNYVALYGLSDDFRDILARNPALASAYYSHLNAGLNATAYYTTNSDLVPKTPYHYARLTVDLSGNVLSLFNRFMPVSGESHLLLGVPYTQFVRAELSLGKTFRWGVNDGQALALRLLGGAGYAYGNSYTMPFEKQFFVGGASSMRGWQARCLGPGTLPISEGFIIPSQTGDFKFEFDMEYRFKMFWKLEGALFAEAGNVWMFNQFDSEYVDLYGTFLEGIAGDWGLGIRVNLDFILIRVDAGFKLRDPARSPGARWLSPGDWFRQNGSAVHLGVGYPF